MNDSYFYGSNHKELYKTIKKDTVNINLTNIETPQTFEFAGFGNNTYYPTRIFITPGDSIHFSLKKGKLRFKGKNSSHYNFYLELDENFDEWTKLRFSKLNADFKEYKKHGPLAGLEFQKKMGSQNLSGGLSDFFSDHPLSLFNLPP